MTKVAGQIGWDRVNHGGSLTSSIDAFRAVNVAHIGRRQAIIRGAPLTTYDHKLIATARPSEILPLRNESLALAQGGNNCSFHVNYVAGTRL
jgi:hypothetical protein